MEVASSSDLSSHRRKLRKRNRHTDIDNNPCSTDAEQSQDQVEYKKRNPLTDLTNSSSNPRQIKRK